LRISIALSVDVHKIWWTAGFKSVREKKKPQLGAKVGALGAKLNRDFGDQRAPLANTKHANVVFEQRFDNREVVFCQR
jgi:hypothetical protein